MPRMKIERAARVRVRSVAIALSLCAGVLFTSAPPAHAVTSYEKQVANYINASRRAAGRRPLTLSWAMSDIAHRHSAQMAIRGRIYHTTSLSYALRNLNWSVAGENVGVGPSLWGVHKAFMRSAPHKANILYRSYERMGVGVVWRNGYAWVTVIFADLA